MEAIKFIGLLALTWLLVEGSQPIQVFKRVLTIHPEDTHPQGSLRYWLVKLFSCCLCLGFWVGLTYYQDLLLASCTSLAAELFARLYKLITNKYLNQL